MNDGEIEERIMRLNTFVKQIPRMPPSTQREIFKSVCLVVATATGFVTVFLSLTIRYPWLLPDAGGNLQKDSVNSPDTSLPTSEISIFNISTLIMSFNLTEMNQNAATDLDLRTTDQDISTEEPLKTTSAVDTGVFNFTYRYRTAVEDLRLNCTQINFASVGKFSSTALASYPGSGNTWTRHLLELTTGYYTGAIYKDPYLVSSFPGEGHRGTDVIAVKTHWPWYKPEKDYLPYKRVVLLVREPLAAMKAEYKRQHSRGRHVFSLQTVNHTEWSAFVDLEFTKWVEFHNFWFTRVFEHDLDLFILFYEDLLDSLPGAMSSVAYFLGVSTNEERLKCVKDHSEGQYHRKSDPLSRDPFSAAGEFPLKMDRLKSMLNEMIRQCLSTRRCVTSGSTSYPLTRT